MNKINTISERAQQKYISGQKTVLLLKALRLCPCDGEVGCQYCNGLGEYYDAPAKIMGILANGRNRSEKKAEFPQLELSEYELIVHPKYQVVKGDRVVPINIPIFESFEERVDKDRDLSFHPARAATIQIYFAGDGKIINYKNGIDFSISKDATNLLFSKTITWISPPPVSREKYVARYQRVPEYTIGEIPEARIAEGKRILQTFTLIKLLAKSETDLMTNSGEKASKTITTGGMTYE